MKYYKEIADVENDKQARFLMDKIEKEYGKIPDSVENLFKVVSVKNRCKKLNIKKLSVSDKNISVVFCDGGFNGVEKLIEYSTINKNIKLKSDCIVFSFNSDIFAGIEWVLGLLNKCC